MIRSSCYCVKAIKWFSIYQVYESISLNTILFWLLTCASYTGWDSVNCFKAKRFSPCHCLVVIICISQNNCFFSQDRICLYSKYKVFLHFYFTILITLIHIQLGLYLGPVTLYSLIKLYIVLTFVCQMWGQQCLPVEIACKESIIYTGHSSYNKLQAWLVKEIAIT